ncbi:amidohydrolase family protein [Rhodoplanes sp. TEM]|uniref:Amidohydrolase family protein n=1 Tax=Rhodoplanes tepidamans TaxID=200616 RepID=A0ABT5J8R2_RHOTP|nr:MULTISPECIES: amidohydrolase family protein [Rhodoplanes]MDC7785997.1 amidohydrolase family protein [Rhodoplanes tepidamans]MDC7984907.1 amidohydrolase family protein [Rhodoplanes sp. TEM]MDQ0357036.1 putative TIM-barrel fold metal-dependent hydrolase [Rhodoplanes tepidamans]
MVEPIVDAHHHIWRRADQPWLQGPTVPRIFGDYEPIKRDYPIEEFLQDLDGCGVVRSVYVQTNWAPAGAVEEVEWVQSVADRTGWPHAIVGFVDLTADDAADVMTAQARCPRMRGVRQQLHWHDNPLYRFAPRPDVMNDAAFRRNFARLEDFGFLFELQVFAGQMADGAALARAFPGVTLVLEHAGMPEDRSPEGRRAWRDGMRRLADAPNVSTKLSALGTFVRRNDPAHIAEIVHETLELFGPERCVWGSNFPIEKLWTNYGAIVDAVRTALAERGAAERRAVLHDNAVRLYHL